MEVMKYLFSFFYKGNDEISNVMFQKGEKIV